MADPRQDGRLGARCVAKRNISRHLGTALVLAAVACVARDPQPPGGPDAAAPPAPADAAPAESTDARPAPPPHKPVVILMIGDGMGRGQLDAASLFAHGTTGALFMQSLPARGEIVTGSLSGITDSAAAATLMATGARTYNGRIGLDRDAKPVETLVERAHRLGMVAGVVTTSSLPHATPAGFTAHRGSRHAYADVALDQAFLTRPEVMLGGGADVYAGLIDLLRAEGARVVTTREALLAEDPASGARLVGVFAPEHLDYVVDRVPESPQPTLAEMSLAALARLDAADTGFFLMIEGARIDMASHENDLDRAVAETLAFDAAVRAVAEWAEGRDDVTILVTADHECGGLQVIAPAPAGTLPQVTWRWGLHTNARVDVFGRGPGSELFASEVRDHVWIHEVAAARLEGRPAASPTRELVPDGRLAELRHRAAVQAAETGFGAGYNQLDGLWLDADARGLAIGVEGVFEWQKNAVVVLIDVDFGAGTGPARLAGALGDHTGRVDALLASLSLDAPAAAGFGVDFAVASWGGADPHLEDFSGDAGLRGLRVPFGEPGNLWWFGAPINFGEGVRTKGVPIAAVAAEGFETVLPWTTLFSGLGGKVPPGATVAIAVVLVNDDGGYTSNQALPPFPPGTPNPGRAITPLPGVAVFTVDADGDGVADGDAPPVVK